MSRFGLCTDCPSPDLCCASDLCRAEDARATMPPASAAADRYADLRKILDRAFDFAAVGKGEQRHGRGGLPWVNQRHAMIGREVGTGFAIGQAVKKALEAGGMDRDAAVRELLGAMTYLASAVHLLELPSADAEHQECPAEKVPLARMTGGSRGATVTNQYGDRVPGYVYRDVLRHAIPRRAPDMDVVTK